MPGLIIQEDEGGIRTLTLNRPDKLNALSSSMVDELSTAVRAAAQDATVRVVVIAGAGRSFCAGYDLSEDPPDSADEIAGSLEDNLDKLLEVFDLPQPVIARVHGHCLAGGCDLMMMCDLVVASSDAVFGQPEVMFGAAIVAHVLPWLIGARRAKEMVFTGLDRLDAPTALEYGLVNRVVPADRLVAETMSLARQLAVTDPEVMRLTKRAVNAAWEAAGFREALRTGVRLGAELELTGSPERVEFERLAAAEGLKAAIEWRDSRFHK